MNSNTLLQIFKDRPIAAVAFCCSIIGFGLGLSNATWQASVETAQVLSGLVKYPPDNAFYVYHVRVFTIINQISAGLLILFKSERFVSMLISGLLGMVSFTALGILIFAFNKSIVISVLSTCFIYFANLVGHGDTYPIWLLGKDATYGILGLSFVLLAISTMAAGAYRWSLFLTGFAPCVHPTLGSWLIVIFLGGCVLQGGFAKQRLSKHWKYFAGGIAAAALSLCIQLLIIKGLPSSNLPGGGTDVYTAFVKYWCSHRKPFYYDPNVPFTFASHAGLYFSILSMALSYIVLKRQRANPDLHFVFAVLIISGTGSLFLGIFTQLPADKMPTFLTMLMPGRFINLNIIVLMAVIIGLLTNQANSSVIGNYICLVFLLLAGFFSRTIEVQIISFTGSFIWLVIYLTRQTSEKPAFKEVKPWIGTGFLFMAFLAVLFAINLPREKYCRKFIHRTGVFRDRTNDEFYSRVASRPGLLLSSAEGSMITLKTRRPVLMDMLSTNFITYVPQAGFVFNDILKNIYGIMLAIPPELKYQHNEIPSLLYKDLWEKRSRMEWKQIGRKYGVTDVLVNENWNLDLPLLVQGHNLSLYQISDQNSTAH